MSFSGERAPYDSTLRIAQDRQNLKRAQRSDSLQRDWVNFNLHELSIPQLKLEGGGNNSLLVSRTPANPISKLISQMTPQTANSETPTRINHAVKMKNKASGLTVDEPEPQDLPDFGMDLT